jgi:hypothetical protein
MFFIVFLFFPSFIFLLVISTRTCQHQTHSSEHMIFHSHPHVLLFVIIITFFIIIIIIIVRGPPDEVYNLREYSRPPANTCEHLRTPSRHLRPHRDTCDLITALATSSRPHCDRFASHYDHPRYTTLPQDTPRTMQQPSDAPGCVQVCNP